MFYGGNEEDKKEGDTTTKPSAQFPEAKDKVGKNYSTFSQL